MFEEHMLCYTMSVWFCVLADKTKAVHSNVKDYRNWAIPVVLTCWSLPQAPQLPTHSWVRSSSQKLSHCSQIKTPSTFLCNRVQLQPSWHTILHSSLHWFLDFILILRVVRLLGSQQKRYKNISGSDPFTPASILSLKINLSISEQANKPGNPFFCALLLKKRNCRSPMHYFTECSFCFGGTGRDLFFSFV